MQWERKKEGKKSWTSDETLIIALLWWLTGLPEGITFPFLSKMLFLTSFWAVLSLQVCCCVTGRHVSCRLDGFGNLNSFSGLSGLVHAAIMMLVWRKCCGVSKNFEPKPFVDFSTHD